MTRYRRIDENGLPSFGSTLEGEPLPEGAIEVEREPGPFEDFVGGAWVHDAKGHADERAGPEHIAEAHLQKRIEAILIRGLDKGLLAPEAAKRGITLGEMADLVIAKSAGFNEAERARQAPDVAEGAKP